MKHKLQEILNIVICSRHLELAKRTDQNFITQNLRHGKKYYIQKKKKLLKQCQKEVIQEYILAFAGWWSIFWEVVGNGAYTFRWWVVVNIFWLVVGRGGWWWVLVDGGIVQSDPQLFIKVYRHPEVLFNRHVLAFFVTSDLKEVFILFFISRITVQC